MRPDTYGILSYFETPLFAEELLRRIPDNYLTYFDQQSYKKFVMDGQLIASPDHSLKHLFLIRKGLAQLSRNDRVDVISADPSHRNYIFGLIEILSDQPIIGKLTALTRCEVISIGKESFLDLFLERPDLREFLLYYLAAGTSFAIERIKNHVPGKTPFGNS